MPYKNWRFINYWIIFLINYYNSHNIPKLYYKFIKTICVCVCVLVAQRPKEEKKKVDLVFFFFFLIKNEDFFFQGLTCILIRPLTSYTNHITHGVQVLPSNYSIYHLWVDPLLPPRYLTTFTQKIKNKFKKKTLF